MKNKNENKNSFGAVFLHHYRLNLDQKFNDLVPSRFVEVCTNKQHRIGIDFHFAGGAFIETRIKKIIIGKYAHEQFNACCLDFVCACV